MISGLRRYAYTISGLALACFFLFPEPNIAVIGALLLQALAYIVIAGKSAGDGVVLTGITLLMIGSLPADHPLIREAFFSGIRPWFIAFGVVVILLGILTVIKLSYRKK